MLRYQPEELERFLLEVDRELNEPVSIIIIGGAAVGLGYGSKRTTKDIDLWPEVKSIQPFWDAVARVKARTGIRIPISPTPEAEAPENFADRLTNYPLGGARHLSISLPERHDLVMMKTARGETPDLEAIVDIHRKEPLLPEILMERYFEMEPIVVGRKSTFRLNFLAMIDAVFGNDVAEQVEKKLPSAK